VPIELSSASGIPAMPMGFGNERLCGTPNEGSSIPSNVMATIPAPLTQATGLQGAEKSRPVGKT
jgi:hypothetical protein